MNPADCPHRPGTDEWKAWQHEALTAETERRAAPAAEGRRHDAGGYGATDDEKVAAGVAPGPPQFRRSGSMPLNEIAEPWRSRVVKALETTTPPPRRPLQELECPWCFKAYKRRHAFEKHVPGCSSWRRVDAPMYQSGDYVPLVAPRPWRIVGYASTAQAEERWAAAAADRRREEAVLVERFGVDVVRAVAVQLGSKRFPNVTGALRVLQLVEGHGWQPSGRVPGRRVGGG